MTWFRYPSSDAFERLRKHGPVIIAVGLIFLVANSYSSAIPVTSGMALIALGSTLAVFSRFRRSPALPAVIVAHLLVYLSLYLLLVGAVLHAAFAKSTGALSLLQSLDLAMSVGPILGAVRIAIGSIAGRGHAPAR
jgi:hypothetical protein